MHPTSQATYQVVSMFGGNYVAEQHRGETPVWLPRPSQVPISAQFEHLLKTLRGNLSLRS